MAQGPHNGFTLGQILLDCSERWGQADQTGTTPAVPTDPGVIDLCLRKINAGYREFLTANSKWTFLEQQVQVLGYPLGDGPDNVEGDAGRYRLPGYVTSTPRHDWFFVGASRPRTRIENRAVQLVRQQRALSSRQTGIPTWAGVGKINEDDAVEGPNHGYEVVFWPAPSLTYLMQNTFRVDGHELVDMTERHIAGMAHDRTIIAFANWEWYRDDAEDAVRDRYKAERDEALARSFSLDNEMRERRRGTMSLDRIRNGERRKTHRYLGRVTYDGIAIGPSQ